MRFVKVLGKTLNKENDSAASYRMNLYDDLNITDLTDKEVEICVANDDGFVGQIIPKVDNPDVMLNMNETVLNGLPAGTYFLEVHVKSADGTVAKYPTSGYVNLNITPDLTKTVDSLVPRITLESMMQVIDQKLKKIQDEGLKGQDGHDGTDGHDGEKGDDGHDGNDGHDGTDGTNGTDGTDGLTPFLAWSDSMDGSKNFSTSNYNLKYAGIAYAVGHTAPTDPHSYTWNLNAEPTVLANNVQGAFDYLLIQSADGSVWRQVIDDNGEVTLTKQ